MVPAVVAYAVGGGLALLASSRPFLTVHVTRSRPLPDLDVAVSGRTVQPAVAGLAVVLLAAVVAVPAVRGRTRQLLGGVLVVVAVALAWVGGRAVVPVSTARARDLVLSARTGTTLDASAAVQVHPHPWWPVLAVLAAVVAGVGGVITLLHGRRWRGLGARYDAPTAPAAPAGVGPPDARRPVAEDNDQPDDVTTQEAVAAERARRDLALWQSLDRGEDPTTTSASDDRAGGDGGRVEHEVRAGEDGPDRRRS